MWLDEIDKPQHLSNFCTQEGDAINRFWIVTNFYPVVYLLININDRSAREMRVEEDGNEKGLSLLSSYHLRGRGSAGLHLRAPPLKVRDDWRRIVGHSRQTFIDSQISRLYPTHSTRLTLKKNELMSENTWRTKLNFCKIDNTRKGKLRK